MPVINESGGCCSYCGVTAEAMDHVPPICTYPIARRASRKYKNLPWVWACKECNSLLSNKTILTVAARAAYIVHRLRTRYSKVLAMPDWSDSELSTLSNHVKSSTLNSIRLKAWVRHRIATAEIIALPEEDDGSMINLITAFHLGDLDL